MDAVNVLTHKAGTTSKEKILNNTKRSKLKFITSTFNVKIHTQNLSILRETQIKFSM